MKEKLHLIYTPFTGVGLHGGFRGDEWFKNRIELFKNYCLASLLNQSNHNFIHWLSFREEEYDNSLTKTLSDYLKSIDYQFVMTFDGLMYHDDKFTHFNWRTKVKNALQMLRDSLYNWEWHSLKYYWQNAWENKNNSLIQRIDHSLRILLGAVGSEYEWVYVTRIDSDDMFHKDVIDLIQQEHPQKYKAIIFQKGFIFNKTTGQLAEWNPPTNPPFHTIIFPSESFFNPKEYYDYFRGFKSHEDIPEIFYCVRIDDKYCVNYHGNHHISTDWHSPLDKQLHHAMKYKGYCYLTHGKNISTRWQSRGRKIKNIMIGKEYGEEEKEGILKQFGIDN